MKVRRTYSEYVIWSWQAVNTQLYHIFHLCEALHWLQSSAHFQTSLHFATLLPNKENVYPYSPSLICDLPWLSVHLSHSFHPRPTIHVSLSSCKLATFTHGRNDTPPGCTVCPLRVAVHSKLLALHMWEKRKNLFVLFVIFLLYPASPRCLVRFATAVFLFCGRCVSLDGADICAFMAATAKQQYCSWRLL